MKGAVPSLSITIPESVTAIGDGAFEECRSLENMTIPKSVTAIGRGAFAGCSSLGSITIPGSVNSLGRHAFAGVVLWKTSLCLSLLQRSGTVLLKGAVSYAVTSRKAPCVMLCDAKRQAWGAGRGFRLLWCTRYINIISLRNTHAYLRTYIAA